MDGAVTCFRDEDYSEWTPQIVLAAVFDLPQAAKSTDSTTESLDDTELWRRVKDVGAHLNERTCALLELAIRRDESLPCYLVTELERPAPEARWCRSVLGALERTPILDGDMRQRATAALGVMALSLRDSGCPEALWSALRRLASVMGLDEVPLLLEFLREADVPTTKQTVLQGIQAIFEVSPPDGDEPALAGLRSRTEQLGAKLLDRDLLASAETSALALNALLAAATLSVDLPVARLREVGPPWLIRALSRGLTRLRASWDEVGCSNHCERIEGAIASLDAMAGVS